MSQTAHMIMGRFQPVHKGHIEMIMEAYNKAIKDDGKNKLYVVISENQGKKEPNNKNPLTKTQRIIMLSKMLPYNKYKNIEFRTSERESWKTWGLTNDETRRIKVIQGTREEKWSTVVTEHLFDIGQYKDGVKKQKQKVIIYVGSDRLEAFKKYNECDNVTVKQCGDNRRESGKQVVFDKDDFEVANILINFQNLTISDDIEKTYSGSQTRDYAYDMDFDNFLDSVKVGDVKDENAMQYMNWVRNGLGESDDIELGHYNVKDENGKKTYIKDPLKLGSFGKLGGKRKTRRKIKRKTKRTTKKYNNRKIKRQRSKKKIYNHNKRKRNTKRKRK